MDKRRGVFYSLVIRKKSGSAAHVAASLDSSSPYNRPAIAISSY